MVEPGRGRLSPKRIRHKPVACDSFLSVARAGKGKHEAGSLSLGAVDGEIALHCPREIAAYRQSQPNPAFPADERFLQLNEWLEDRLLLLGGNADSCVADLQCHSFVSGGAARADVATRWRELDRG